MLTVCLIGIQVNMADIATFDLKGVTMETAMEFPEKADELVTLLSEVGFILLINHEINQKEVPPPPIPSPSSYPHPLHASPSPWPSRAHEEKTFLYKIAASEFLLTKPIRMCHLLKYWKCLNASITN